MTPLVEHHLHRTKESHQSRLDSSDAGPYVHSTGDDGAEEADDGLLLELEPTLDAQARIHQDDVEGALVQRLAVPEDAVQVEEKVKN